MMNKNFLRTLSALLIVNHTMVISAFAQDPQYSGPTPMNQLHTCEKPFSFSKHVVIDGITQTFHKIVTDAKCGIERDPKTGKLEPFKTFIDPYNKQIIVEQYCILQVSKFSAKLNKNVNSCKKIETYSRKIEAELPQTQAYAPAPTDDTATPATLAKPEDHTVRNVVITGFSILAVVGAIFGVREMMKPHATVETTHYGKDDKVSARMAARSTRLDVRPKGLEDMPTKITLTKEIPHGAGKRVSVAGAVPESQVPTNVARFTSHGNTYFIQQNPHSDLFEAILISQYLERPYFYPGVYGYDNGFSYSSPYLYGSNNDIIVNQTYIDNSNSADINYNHDTYADSQDVVAREDGLSNKGFIDDSGTQLVSDEITTYDNNDKGTDQQVYGTSEQETYSRDDDFTPNNDTQTYDTPSDTGGGNDDFN